jgi:hypothetical protein
VVKKFVAFEGELIMLRSAVVVVALAAGAGTVGAEQLSVEGARQFVLGKLFAFNCFEGTRGAGRIYSDGSVAGTVQFRGSGPVRYVVLPPGTVRAQGQAVCASVAGIPFQPCFDLDRTDQQSFRGSIAGLRFAYCDFTRRSNRPLDPRTSDGAKSPLDIHAAAMGVSGDDD